jgi:hypothetical protein
MAVEQFPRHNTAEFLNLVYLPVNGLLQDFVDHFEIPREVCSFQASGQVDIDIKIRDEDNRPFFMAMYFNEFFYVFYADAGEVNPDIRGSCLNIGKFPGE